jgi:hypothetical protein
MERHPTKLKGFETLEEAAYAIENLSYDSLRELMLHLRRALVARAKADKLSGRVQLARRLEDAAHNILNACVNINHAWTICETKTKP